MDNLSNALYMAFSIFVLILALAVSLMLFRKANQAAQVMMEFTNRSKYIEKLDIEKLIEDNDTDSDLPKVLSTRLVKKDTIIPVIYRYSLESLLIKIYDDKPYNGLEFVKGKTLDQMFYKSFEMSFKTYKSKIKKMGASASTYDKEYLKLFDDKKSPAYLYNVPWTNEHSQVQQRIEYYIHGQKAFINGVEVDYSNSLIAKDDGTGEYREIVLEYPYDGVVKQELDYLGDQVYLENEVVQEQVGHKNTEIIYIKVK